MYIHDSHVHTKYSFDAEKDINGEISTIIEAAIARGIDEISLCDHCDIDGILDGIYPPFDADSAKRDSLRLNGRRGETGDAERGAENETSESEAARVVALFALHCSYFLIVLLAFEETRRGAWASAS